MLNVKTEVFEGPLHALLSLIEKRKLFINDISLAAVTDEFLQSLSGEAEVHTSNHAEFVLVASTLLLIKSKSLLPSLSLTEEEQHSIEDLEARLREYQKIQNAAKKLRALFGKNILFQKNQSKRAAVFLPDERITCQNMFTIISDIIRNIPKLEKLPKTVIAKVMSLEEMIDRLSTRISSGLKMSFSEFAPRGAKTREEKVHVIVSFLAMLELVKQGIIHVSQQSHNDEIEMESHSLNVPQYGTS